MMHRRDFFGKLTGSTALIATPLTLPELTRLGETLHWAGWQIRWDGWRQGAASDWIYGFWIARLPAAHGQPERWAHWCTNGVGGLHEIGHVFDLRVREALGFRFLTGDAEALAKDRAQLRALRYLLAFLDDPRQDPDLLILPDA